MHELSVTESILDICRRYGEQAQATRVTDIYIEVGSLSSIVDDSVQFYWDIISDQTICKGATLHFTRHPAKLACTQCGQEFILNKELEPCPSCGSFDIKVLSGEEFWVDSIEIEKEEQTA